MRYVLCSSSVGNRRFRSIIADAIDDYNAAPSRKSKSAVVKRVHDSIKTSGGRFLKLDHTQGAWKELSVQRSLEKVSHAIRDANSTNENMKKKKETMQSTIAQVAAHVTSKYPGVRLDHSESDQGERLAFSAMNFNPNSASSSNLPGHHESHPQLLSPLQLSGSSAFDPLESAQRQHLARLQSTAALGSSSSSIQPTVTRSNSIFGSAAVSQEDLFARQLQQQQLHLQSSQPLAQQYASLPPLQIPPMQQQQQQQQRYFAAASLPEPTGHSHLSSSHAQHAQPQPQLQPQPGEPPGHYTHTPSPPSDSDDPFVSYINEVLGPVPQDDLVAGRGGGSSAGDRPPAGRGTGRDTGRP